MTLEEPWLARAELSTSSSLRSTLFTQHTPSLS